MNNQNILMVLTLGCLSAILAALVVVILGFKLNIHMIYLSLLLGVLISILVGLALKFKYRNIENQLQSSKIQLGDDEIIIIDGKASYNNSVGRLFLTDQRIVFSSNTPNKNISSQSEIDLHKITSIEKYKTAGLIPNGVTLYESNIKHTFTIDFADDWCRIIDWQLLLTKSREKDFKSNLLSSINKPIT